MSQPVSGRVWKVSTLCFKIWYTNVNCGPTFWPQGMWMLIADLNDPTPRQSPAGYRRRRIACRCNAWPTPFIEKILLVSLVTEATLCWSVRKYFYTWRLVMLTSPTATRLLLVWIISSYTGHSSLEYWPQDHVRLLDQQFGSLLFSSGSCFFLFCSPSNFFIADGSAALPQMQPFRTCDMSRVSIEWTRQTGIVLFPISGDWCACVERFW